MAFDFTTLITDRSPEDLQALRDLLATPMADWTAEQLAAFNQAASKGAYNYTDLNRVTAAMDDINERLTAAGYMTGYQKILVHSDAIPVQDEHTLLLLHGDTLLDSSIYNVNIQNHGVSVSSDQSKFGEFSLYFNGNSSLVFLSSNLMNTDFTIDWWEYCLGGNSARIFTGYYPETSDFAGILISWSDGNCYFSASKNTWDIFSGVPAIDTLTGQWVHRAIVKYGNTWTSYKNGIKFWEGISDKSPYFETGLLSAIGQYLDSDSSKYYGYINEFRISDVARWTSNFTPPTEPYVIESESPIDPYTWYESDAPTPVQMTQYIANVEALKEVLTLANNAPELPPDMDGLTIQEANYMEEILAMINLYLLALQRVFLRSEMPWAVSGGPGFYFEN